MTEYEQYYFRPGGRLNVSQIVAQRAQLRDLLVSELTKGLPESAYPSAVRLAFLDAAPYDPYLNLPGRPSPTGGCNGSARFAEELARPEGAGLQALVDALGPIKASIDAKWAAIAAPGIAGAAKAGSPGSLDPPGPISWADLIAMAGVVAVQRKWGTAGQHTWPVQQGRVDAPPPPLGAADPEGRSPSPPGPAFDSTSALDLASLVRAGVWATHAGLGAKRLAVLWAEMCGGLAEGEAALRGAAAAQGGVEGAAEVAAGLAGELKGYVEGGEEGVARYRADYIEVRGGGWVGGWGPGGGGERGKRDVRARGGLYPKGPSLAREAPAFPPRPPVCSALTPRALLLLLLLSAFLPRRKRPTTASWAWGLSSTLTPTSTRRRGRSWWVYTIYRWRPFSRGGDCGSHVFPCFSSLTGPLVLVLLSPMFSPARLAADHTGKALNQISWTC